MCLIIEGDYVSHDWRAATYIMIGVDVNSIFYVQ